jgi:glycerol-3-phosphate dehydrogenase
MSVAAPRPSSLSAGRRLRDLETLAGGELVDVLVVGGGVTGTAVALDAATRGLRVALVERRDLAHGTSRWSSKLVHGGLRYLAQGRLGLAYESAVERAALLDRTAPHLTRPLAMLFPAGAMVGAVETGLYGLGMEVGNLLRAAAGTARTTLPAPRWVTAQEIGLLAPALQPEGLRGGWLSWDGQLVDDARLVVALARTAAAFGARIVTAAEALAVDGAGALVRDELAGGTFQVRARAVVNATGVWAERLHPEVTLRPSKGAHLLVPADRLRHPRVAVTVAVPNRRNRYVFAAPQADGLVLLGLTDDPVASVTDDPVADEADESFLLGVFSAALRVPLTPQDVVGSFAGLRPLLAADDGDRHGTADLSRAHRIFEREDGVTTIVGGKLTTARRMAEDVVDRVLRRRDWSAGPCVTQQQPLVGAAPRGRLAALPAPTRLVQRYGTEAPELLAWAAADPDLGEPVAAGSDHLRVELAWAVRHEGALTVSDLLDRRTRIGLVAAARRAAEPTAAATLASHLDQTAVVDA